MVPGQRLESSETQIRAGALRRLQTMVLRESPEALPMKDLVSHDQSRYVPGRGSMGPVLAFVQERPSLADASTRAPLSGAAGRVFDKLLLDVGMTRNDLYVTNLVPWYPPNGRETTVEERGYGAGWLQRELRILGGPPLVLLGRETSKHVLVRPYESLAGKWAYSTLLRSWCLSLPHPACAVYQEKNLETLKRHWRLLRDIPAEATDATV